MAIMTFMEIQAKILVVDDELKNRKLLGDLLEAQGHQVTVAEDGQQALDEIAKDPPDVVLLDIMMPKMDGFEVCRRLKADPKTAAIPILLVTALRERDDRLKGIEAGANDFISKPVDTQEVILRARNAAYAKQLYDTVEENLERLKELEILRDNLTHMVVHDMRSPLMGISGYLDLLKLKVGDSLGDKETEYVGRARASASVLVEMISSMLDVSKLESGQMPLAAEECDLTGLAREAAVTVALMTGGDSPSVEVGGESVAVECDLNLIRRVFVNLTANAIKFSPKDGTVRVQIEKTDGAVKAAVSDTGNGIPPEFHDKIFEKFGQMEGEQARRKYSTGLGLTFCKLAVEAHGGEIGLESEVGKGATFWFVLPSS